MNRLILYDFRRNNINNWVCNESAQTTLEVMVSGVIYQRCLAIELRKTGLDFIREKEQPIFMMEVGTKKG